MRKKESEKEKERRKKDTGDSGELEKKNTIREKGKCYSKRRLDTIERAAKIRGRQEKK